MSITDPMYSISNKPNLGLKVITSLASDQYSILITNDNNDRITSAKKGSSSSIKFNLFTNSRKVGMLFKNSS